MAEEVVQNQNNNDQQSNVDKETKKFNEALEKVTKLVGGKKGLFPAKTVDAETTASLVAELFEEENKELEKKIKQALRDLIKAYATMQKEINAKKRELEELELKKKKEFTQSANELLSKIDQAVFTNDSYADILKSTIEARASFDESPMPVVVVSGETK